MSKYELTEFGNRDRVLDLYGENIRYTNAWGFMVWDRKKWTRNNSLVKTMCEKAILSIYKDAQSLLTAAASETDQNTSKGLAAKAENIIKWGKHSQSDYMVKAVMSLASNRCEVDAALFDNKPWLLNCQNGTLDLKTGSMHPHKREDYLTRITNVSYEPANIPVFMSFIQQVMLDRQDLVAFIQQALGYSISGDTSEQVWFILHGSGENGKSTLMDAVAYALGDYAQNMQAETITAASQKDGSSPSPDIARLKGARLVTVPETEEGARLKTSLIKQMTGQDTLTARFLHHDPFDFIPTHKLFLYTNHKPHVRETTHAFWRRVRMIPFDYQVPQEKKDKHLPEKLKSEASGILSWLMQGCIAYQKHGLQIPLEVARATQEYRNDQDILGLFIRECCVTGSSNISISSGQLYEAYKKWSNDEMNEKPMVARSFKRQLEEKGFSQHRYNYGNEWQGIRIAEEGEKDEQTSAEVVSINTDNEQAPVNAVMENEVKIPEELRRFSEAMANSGLDKIFTQHPQGNKYLPLDDYVRVVIMEFYSADASMQKWAREQIEYRNKEHGNKNTTRRAI